LNVGACALKEIQPELHGPLLNHPEVKHCAKNLLKCTIAKFVSSVHSLLRTSQSVCWPV